MSVEALRSISEKLREMYRFGRDEQITTEVTISQDEYYVDLGAFGEQSLSIELEDDEVYLDAEEILNKYPIETSEFDDYADTLDEFIAVYEQQQAEDDIEVVLKRIEASGGAPLVAAIRAAIAAFQSGVPVSVGPVPEKPLPWPGALRPEIDYTAADFPLRYDPPPGFIWSASDYITTPLAPSEAVSVPASSVKSNVMVMDVLGRVRWIKQDELDNFSSGIRWRVWHQEREVPGVGTIPEATGFSTDTPPRALDADGRIIPEAMLTEGTSYSGAEYNWSSGTDAAAAAQALGVIRAQAAPAVMVGGVIAQLNEYGVTYDPLTIQINEESVRRFSEDLRVGDRVNSYGRLLSIEKTPDGEFLARFDNGGTDKRARFSWSIRSIDGWEGYPSALSISEAKRQEVTLPIPETLDFAKVDYDPLTVEVASDEDTVQSSELRLGDDITGSEFGRVINVAPTGDGGFTITMNRDGTINVQTTSFDEFWSVQPIVGVDRYAQPPAASLVGGAPPAYDPLTVEVDGSASIMAQDLRVGDLVTGSGFGRVLQVVEDQNKPGYAILTLNYEGKINVITGYKLDQTWGTKKIVGVDRDMLPTAYSLGIQQAKVQVPFYDVINGDVAEQALTSQRFDTLRFGDLVTGGSFGRLVAIRAAGSGTFTAVLFNPDNATTNEWPRARSDTWSIKPLVPVDLRGKTKPALTVFEESGRPEYDARTVGTPTVGYDPLTVKLGPDIRSKTSELRLGDDITGGNLGRVTAVTRQPNGYLEIVMDRNGTRNTYTDEGDRSWNILPIIGVDRASQPTALAFGEGAPPTSILGGIDYDPLTIEVVESYLDCKAREMRLGDDVVGSSFGRVVGVEDGKLILDRNGKRTSIEVDSENWSIYPIQRADRLTIPTAVELGLPAPMVAPF